VSEILLQTKLHMPTLRLSLIPRPHLIEKLDAGLAGKLTLVSAPPGFGKSTLVSSWVQQKKRPCAWLALGPEDNEPNRFLSYLVAALQKIDEELGKTAVSLLQSPQPPPPQISLTLILNDLAALPQPSILVLEDYHVIHNLDIHKALSFFLDNLPSQLHLVITSREDPPLPLHRLRSSGQMNGIYVHDLRFSQDESATFLQQTMHIDLIPEDVTALARRTEGWIAGLQLAALSLQGLPDPHAFVAGFAGDDRYIVDYLLNEVLERQPDHIREFLLQTAVLYRFCPSLCDAILQAPANHSQAILTYLDEANLFIIPLDNKREWYRYHHLFSDFLRLRAQNELANKVTLLYQRAAIWYEENGFLEEAIESALSGTDYERASRLIEQNGMNTIFGHAQWVTFLNWMKALPPEMVQSQPQLNLHFAWALFSTGQWPETKPYLKEVELAFRAGKLSADQNWMLGEVATIRALVTYEMGDLARSKEMAALAHELLPETNKTIRSVAVLAEGMAHMWRDDDLQTKHQYLQKAQELAQEAANVTVGLFALGCKTMLDVRAGRLTQAARQYQQARALGTIDGDILLGPAGFACVQMGEVLREWDRLEEAESVLREGIKLCQQQLGMPVWIIEGHVNLARLKLANGDEQQAEKLIQQAAALLVELPRHGETVRHLISATQVYRLRFWLAQGKLNTAVRWLAKNGITSDTAVFPENLAHHVLLARIFFKQGQLKDTQKQLQKIQAILTKSESHRLTAEIFILQALLSQAQGDREQAASKVASALQMSEPEGYVRLFVDFGEPMASLLETAVQQNIAPTYTQKLLSAFDKLPSPSSPALSATLIEPLNDRERQTLKLIAAGLSNREIAEELYLSVNTIKAYTSRIYGKLGVNGRAEAINHAHELGIL
jgi:LuxR family maltose regulon positive regulatory protein